MNNHVKLLEPSQQVFAIPELLEWILLHLGQFNSLPGLQLYVLQRMNRTFQQVIQSSMGIRECMQRTHISETDPYVQREDLASIRWLPSRLPNTIPPIKTIDAFWPGHIGATLNQLSIDLCTAGRPRANEEQIRRFASHDVAWRQMKLASLPLQGEIFLDVELIDVQARLMDGRDRSVTRLQISAEVLGDLFDVVEQIRARTAEEHIAWEKRPKMGVVNPPNVKEIFILEDLF
ncbi:hypothetical protein Q7P35_004557 [Cladosporium inversicolor]